LTRSSDPQAAPGVETVPSVRETGVRPTTAAIGPGPTGEHIDKSGTPGYTPTLDAEIALVRRAHEALIEGRAEESLAALDEHLRRFPNGVLAEDREAQRVLTLCALGRLDVAREEGQRFAIDHPQSPHMAAIRTSCVLAR
jgi:RNA polymerase sigma-70 factor (ECF subfamily)